ncbi:butirosin biosynthesis protein H-like [Ruminiclostridium sufflavum DSM 19573]|uniref:Butirosin biosynthesis protein H-like n=1 Tax=Ruminiclostridium sufflavum DSM 19573 TaxID=1121337 RepID=A0A318XPD4_9FIRM|nr:BtrH N-terminal domain-containing protein [Ruminiclostridium sufflavum]PYG90196.1 butirosin biosynthesis protein H-like [Ruminiclostridium sufflavum DSM 19573]
MKRELFINRSPLLSGYSFYGGIFSILPDSEKIMPWVYNNFIQLKFILENDLVFFDRYRSLLDGCPFFNHYVLMKSELEERGKQFLADIIKDKIDNGAYCFIYIDRYYIPFHKMWFERGHLTHEMLVYGYDDEKEEFLCADNGDNGNYEYFTCSYSQLLDGYWKNENDDPYYFSMHYVQDIIIPEEQYMLNYGQVKRSLKNYLNSISMLNESEEVIFSKFGFSVHNMVLENQKILIQKYEDKFYFNLRQIYILIDHKELMRRRLNFLFDKGYLTDDSFEKKYEYLAFKYKILLSLCIKYNIKNKKELLNKYFDLFSTLIEYEKNALEDLVSCLYR